MLLSDTVGFISDLPIQVMYTYFNSTYPLSSDISLTFLFLAHAFLQLVKAFQSTLEEVVEADLLLVRAK